jgi:hypothetical protein
MNERPNLGYASIVRAERMVIFFYPKILKVTPIPAANSSQIVLKGI